MQAPAAPHATVGVAAAVQKASLAGLHPATEAQIAQPVEALVTWDTAPAAAKATPDNANAQQAASAAGTTVTLALSIAEASQSTPSTLRKRAADVMESSQSQAPGYAAAREDKRNGSPKSSAVAAHVKKQKQLAQLSDEHLKQAEELLLSALVSPMGFHKGTPLAAMVVFRTCLQWKAFQADETSIFDRIIQVIDSQIQQQHDDNACLAYWLTNTVTLLLLLERNIKPASGSSGTVKRVAAAAGPSILEALPGRQPGAGDAAILGGGVGGFRQVEAKIPVLLFKQQLDELVQKIFSMIRDSMKQNITPMLGQCFYTARDAPRRTAAAAAAPTSSPHNAWSDLLLVFEDLLTKLKDNHVPKPLVQIMLKQLFSSVNVQLFNMLLLRPGCCSFSNGGHLKAGLAQVESWINQQGTECVGECWEELKCIRQAVAFLVASRKEKLTLGQLTQDLCPALSIKQLFRISTMFSDDKYNTETVNSQVLGDMKKALSEQATGHSNHNYLLDDDSTLPCVTEEMLVLKDDKDLYAALPMPEALRSADKAGSFAFLEKELQFTGV